MDFTTKVKLEIYQVVGRTGEIPDAAQIAATLGKPLQLVKAAFQRLAENRLLVLEPESASEIRMAPPFSGIPTPFRVVVDRVAYYANCIWDAYGISAALGRDARIETSDGTSGELMVLQIVDGDPENAQAIFHFAVPAAQWWENIVYT